MTPSSTDLGYAQRLQRISSKSWKRYVPNPYRWLIRRLAVGNVLDIGCGVGRCLGFLEGRAVGVDPNPDAVAMCVAQGYRATTPDEFWAGDTCASRFDTVLCAHVVEHLTHADAVAMLAPYVQLLRRGGTLVLVVPQERGHHSDPTHVRLVSADDLHELCRDLGVLPIRTRSFPLPSWMGRWFIYSETIVVASTSG